MSCIPTYPLIKLDFPTFQKQIPLSKAKRVLINSKRLDAHMKKGEKKTYTLQDIKVLPRKNSLHQRARSNSITSPKTLKLERTKTESKTRNQLNSYIVREHSS